MNQSFMDFVFSGKVGLVEVGLTRNEVLKRLGVPSEWGGKPPAYGPQTFRYEESTAWYFYNEAVNLIFDSAGVVIEIVVYPDKIDNQMPPFVDWPLFPGVTMGAFRSYLIENSIPFTEGGVGDNEVHYLFVAERCYTYCTYYENGRPLALDERVIIFFANTTDIQRVPWISSE